MLYFSVFSYYRLRVKINENHLKAWYFLLMTKQSIHLMHDQMWKHHRYHHTSRYKILIIPSILCPCKWMGCWIFKYNCLQQQPVKLDWPVYDGCIYRQLCTARYGWRQRRQGSQTLPRRCRTDQTPSRIFRWSQTPENIDINMKV